MTSKKAKALSNHEIVTLAVYLLGGDSKRIDTEDVAVKANELAPGRFAWRKYPNQINIENVRTFLSDAKKPKNGAYTLSSGTISNGIVTVPKGMKQHLSGPYELRVAGGAPIGQLVVKNSQAWGLGPLFTRRGGDPGDSLRILFDLKTKIAVAELGQASVDEEDEVNQQLVK
jgi:hypothetical protein